MKRTCLSADEITGALNRVCDAVGAQDEQFVSAAAKRVLENSEWTCSATSTSLQGSLRTQHSGLLYHPHPMRVTVNVELKPSVLDPQGKAIQHSLQSLGFAGVEDVRAGKTFRITLADREQPR